MHEEKKHEIREPKESLHWISYNARLQTKLLEDILSALKRIEMTGKPNEFARQEDLPF